MKRIEEKKKMVGGKAVLILLKHLSAGDVDPEY